MFDDYQSDSAPSWLGGANGQLWLRVLGIVKDSFVAMTMSGVKQRFAAVAHPSSLVDLLADRNLEPAYNEAADAVRARLLVAWKTWEYAGTVQGLKDALALAGYAGAQVIEATNDGTLQWWEFDVVVSPPFPWTDTHGSDTAWDDGGLWDDGGSWAASLPEGDMSRLRAVVRKWSSHPNTHARCRFIVIQHTNTPTWDGDGAAAWDDAPSVTWGDEVSYLTP